MLTLPGGVPRKTIGRWFPDSEVMMRIRSCDQATSSVLSELPGSRTAAALLPWDHQALGVSKRSPTTPNSLRYPLTDRFRMS
ncbi:hypothetical protein, partial [Streptomyces torulosus]|uniref:hypothetical protein n=1 Tax=Streptomyces torulosus TaxID=68276 RepID=UPI0019D24E59